MLPGRTAGMESNTTFTLEVQQDEKTGDYYITPPEGMLKSLGWGPGDKIDWLDNKDGTFTLIKVN